jgi:hypothetical protein
MMSKCFTFLATAVVAFSSNSKRLVMQDASRKAMLAALN